MNKINLKPSTLKFSLLIITMISFSCKRESDLEMSQLNQALIGKAKQFYQRETIVFETKNRQILSSEAKNSTNGVNPSVDPLWDRAEIQTTDNGRKIVTVPMPDFGLNSKTSAYTRRIIFSTSGENVNQGQIVEVFSSPSEISANGEKRISDALDGTLEGFTGAVMSYNLNYIFREGRLYENGKARKGVAKLAKGKSLLKGKLVLPASENIVGGSGKLAVTPATISAVTPEFEGQDCENYYLVYIERDEFGNIVYWENRGYQYTICKSTNPGSPNPGGSSTDVYVDCNKDVLGNAYQDSCGDCVGGNTGLMECLPRDTAMTEKFVKNPKAMCALNKLMQDNLFKNILNNFIGANKPVDLTFRLDFIPQTPGFQTDANTVPNPATWNSNNIDITLAENLIGNLSSLEVAVALIHEGIHAEIFRKLISIQGPGNLSTNNFPSLFNMYNQYKVNQGYTHEFMANYYVDLMASALRKFDNNKFSIDYYEALAWSGLKGTAPYTNLSLAKKNDIATKEAALLLNRTKTNCDDSQ